MQKKVIEILILTLVIFSLSIGFVSAADSCDIRLRTECGTYPWNNIVMGVSGLTNAHGEFPDTGIYSHVLCCNFGIGDTVCDEDERNKIIGLSATTNAHAEIPSNDNYGTDVCYEDLECASGTNSCPDGYSMGILSLSANTNAHIGKFSDNYPIKICCIGECSLLTASWSKTSAIEVEPVDLIVTGTSKCEGEVVSFEVWEKDTLFDDSVNINPEPATFVSGNIIGNWIAEWQDDKLPNGNGNPPEYYFEATLVSNPDKTIESNELTVTEVGEEICINKDFCRDYQDSGYCNSDVCDVGDNSAPPEVDCSTVGTNCGCAWDSISGICEFSLSYETGCGNGVVDSYVEECDGSDFNGLSCESYSLQSGSLTCTENCKINTGNCLGTPGVCEDGNINPGETCDGTNKSNLECVDFDDFNEGILNCYPQGHASQCLIDTSQCTGGVEPSFKIGTCNYKESTDDDCSDGFLTYSWIANWTWDSGNTEHYDPNKMKDRCVDGENTIVCPTEIELPFFGFYSLIIAGILIAIIYKFLILNKKKHK